MNDSDFCVSIRHRHILGYWITHNIKFQTSWNFCPWFNMYRSCHVGVSYWLPMQAYMTSAGDTNCCKHLAV
ncbi:unnamed protein product [Danaus chrysippus]|uniref:(African queen) hypothetical protein n=1 Tax=Danaus chrysippus TaxID=151541 RepID=A0A8J2QFW0_9NEOP|nr:unnamed protein product [Danaus chrysippus]